MKVYYDLHIHSCLSPCGSEEMTPNNLINMAAISGLHAVALTDHNSSKNCPAAAQVAQQAGITFLPGMELCTAEEIHVVCLFASLERAMAFDQKVEQHLLPIQNRPEVFGHQSILDAEDQPLAEFPTLLTAATSISIDEVPDLMQRYGGVAFPAHIDRSSYSVISALGDFPSIGFSAAEITDRGDVQALKEKYPLLRDMPLVLDSDAHDLEVIQQPGAYFELPDCTAQTIFDALAGRIQCKHYRE